MHLFASTEEESILEHGKKSYFDKRARSGSEPQAVGRSPAPS
jgi:hypothetical protein